MALTIAEEIFLLALYEKGSIPNAVALPLRYALGGALLAESLAAGKIRLDEQKKVRVLDSAPCGDASQDAMLEKMRSAHHPHKVTYWINAVTHKPKKLLKRLGEGLVQKGILNQEEKRFLWVIPYVVFPQQDASAKYWIKQHLRAVVLAGEIADAHSILVLSLVRAAGLLDFVFTRDELKAARKRIDAITGDTILDPDVRAAVMEINTAVTALVISAVRP